MPEISALSDCLRRMQQKKVVGNGHRVSLLLASLIASVMLIFADTVARNLFSPIEIPAGIAVSLVGVPYFVYLMWKE